MQPLYSVDHESRHNAANHIDEETQAAPTSESSPLLQRFPQYVPPRNPVTMIIVSLLLLILVAGIIIGIYLLVIQSESENILPPVETPVHLVSRKQWDHSNASQTDQVLSPYTSKAVIIVQTNTDRCWNTETCIKLLQAMQANLTAAKMIMPYNFLISSDGQTYEALGWHRASPVTTLQPSNELVLAFIGNFNEVPPTSSQIQEAKNFLAMAESQQHLNPTYRILGRNIEESPANLTKSLERLPQWSREFVDVHTN